MHSTNHPRYILALLLIVACLLAACSQSPLAPPKAPDAAATVSFEPTLPQRTLLPPVPSAQMETPSPTISGVTPTQTLPILVRPSVTPSPLTSITPGVFATAIRLSPAKPIAGGDYVTFYVTFLNTTPRVQTYKWKVKIWSPDDARNSFGETTTLTTEIPVGVSEIPSAANWRTNPGPCTPFVARVYVVNTDLSPDPIEFRKPDGSPGPQTPFQVCPPS